MILQNFLRIVLSTNSPFLRIVLSTNSPFLQIVLSTNCLSTNSLVTRQPVIQNTKWVFCLTTDHCTVVFTFLLYHTYPGHLSKIKCSISLQVSYVYVSMYLKCTMHCALHITSHITQFGNKEMITHSTTVIITTWTLN